MSQSESKLTIGILADVDAGKTTLSEAMLYIAGALRKKAELTTATLFWTPTKWSASAVSRFFQSRRSLSTAV